MNYSQTKRISECPTCAHPQTPAVHSISVLGQVQCTMCPRGLCAPTGEQVDPLLTVAGNGIALIGQMSRQDLIEEIILGQRGNLASCSVDQLRRFVIQLRMRAVHERLHAEAGISDGDSWFGS